MHKRICYVCKTETKVLCRRCKSIYYCSKSCQKSHWNKHKADCFDREKIESQLQEYDNTSKELYAICAIEFDAISDERIKTNIQNLGSSLDIILQVGPITFNKFFFIKYTLWIDCTRNK